MLESRHGDDGVPHPAAGGGSGGFNSRIRTRSEWTFWLIPDFYCPNRTGTGPHMTKWSGSGPRSGNPDLVGNTASKDQCWDSAKINIVKTSAKIIQGSVLGFS